jgi:hypothetical protein
MAVKTQGTDLYYIDPEDGSVNSAGCITAIDGIDTTIEQIETTCLNGTARTYVAGLATPGTATFTINTDLKDSNHTRLLELKQAGTTLQWAVGWSEAPGVPPSGADSNGFITPTSRSWLLFEGFMNSFPFSFQLNSVVTSTVGIQVSGDVTAIAAVI